MCGLCGLWGNVSHWSSSSSRAVSGGPPAGVIPLRERMLQVQVVHRASSMIGVQVEDWAGSSWMVRNSFGGTEIVSSLPEIWRAAEKLSGRRLDPLALPILEKLESGQ